jgi:hypothetical protein
MEIEALPTFVEVLMREPSKRSPVGGDAECQLVR